MIRKRLSKNYQIDDLIYNHLFDKIFLWYVFTYHILIFNFIIMKLKLINLTGHNIDLLNNDNEISLSIPSDWIARLDISIIDISYILPLVKREVKWLILPDNITKEELKKADAIIVSAQMVEYMKSILPKINILTVWETVRSKDDSWRTIILWAKNLVLNS